MNRTRRYIEAAIKIARQAPHDHQYKVGCVIINNGALIGVGHNEPSKTHPRATTGYRWPSLHAELAAIIGVSESDLRGAIAYVARVRKVTRTGIARPCEGCQYHLCQVGVKRVHYTTNTEEIGSLKL